MLTNDQMERVLLHSDQLYAVLLYSIWGSLTERECDTINNGADDATIHFKKDDMSLSAFENRWLYGVAIGDPAYDRCKSGFTYLCSWSRDETLIKAMMNVVNNSEFSLCTREVLSRDCKELGIYDSLGAVDFEDTTEDCNLMSKVLAVYLAGCGDEKNVLWSEYHKLKTEPEEVVVDKSTTDDLLDAVVPVVRETRTSVNALIKQLHKQGLLNDDIALSLAVGDGDLL